jgi:hypothetical protein
MEEQAGGKLHPQVKYTAGTNPGHVIAMSPDEWIKVEKISVYQKSRPVLECLWARTSVPVARTSETPSGDYQQQIVENPT